MARYTNQVARQTRRYVVDRPDSSAPQDSNPPPRDNESSSSRPRKFTSQPRSTGLKSAKDRFEASEKRRLYRQRERDDGKVCFACRERGHSARDCPQAVSVEKGTSKVGKCYRCGSEKHSLSRCRKPENRANPLPFAECFVCGAQGHLSGTCPQNANGLYPNGGGCKVCGKNDHLVKDCEMRTLNKASAPVVGLEVTAVGEAGADEDDFHTLKRRAENLSADDFGTDTGPAKKRKPQVLLNPKKTKVVVF